MITTALLMLLLVFGVIGGLLILERLQDPPE